MCRHGVHSDSTLVMGSVVITSDRFKFWIGSFLSLFGKNLTVYEVMLERGRREAMIRLKLEAHAHGYNQVYGIRFETTIIENGTEILAYGTAVKAMIGKVAPSLLAQNHSFST